MSFARGFVPPCDRGCFPMGEKERRILHLDMDAFFASVEIRDNPSLRGKPVIVAGLTARGVVCAASYEARRFGVRSAMPTQQARVLCKKGIFLRPRLARYREVSRRILEIAHEFTDLVEPVSIDECYMDVTENKLGVESAEQLGRRLKQRIRDELGLTASVGIAPCKFLAKIASDLRKPDGLVVIAPEQVEDFLADLPVERIPGIGPVTKRKFHGLGIRKIGELRRLSRDQLRHLFGKSGERLYEFARGIDDRPVVVEREPKSLSRERTFETDTRDLDEIRRALRRHCEAVAGRLAAAGFRARAVELKIRYGDFKTVTRRLRLNDFFDDAETIYQTALDLLGKTDAGRRPVRLVGVCVGDLAGGEGVRQLRLFE